MLARNSSREADFLRLFQPDARASVIDSPNQHRKLIAKLRPPQSIVRRSRRQCSTARNA